MFISRHLFDSVLQDMMISWFIFRRAHIKPLSDSVSSDNGGVGLGMNIFSLACAELVAESEILAFE
jgi:hypothetical protein